MAEQARRLRGRVAEHVEERDGVVRTTARRYVLITEDFCVKASSARCALALARLRLRVASSLLASATSLPSRALRAPRLPKRDNLTPRHPRRTLAPSLMHATDTRAHARARART